jgi:hypothetical protein
VSHSFRSKAQGAFLPALLKKADRIQAKSLLFNIDQKASLINKDQSDALLKVFAKVFDVAAATTVIRATSPDSSAISTTGASTRRSSRRTRASRAVSGRKAARRECLKRSTWLRRMPS